MPIAKIKDTHIFDSSSAHSTYSQTGNLSESAYGFTQVELHFKGAESFADHSQYVGPRINNVLLNIKHMKAGIRANVDHPFRVIKCQFGFTKARYRGLKKNDHKLSMLFALANVVGTSQMMKI